MEIRNHLITQFKEFDEFRINERLKQNADDVGVPGGDASTFPVSPTEASVCPSA